MPRSISESYVGTHFSHDAAVCVMPAGAAVSETELLLKERFTRVKHDHGHLDLLAFAMPAGVRARAGLIAGNPGFWDPYEDHGLSVGPALKSVYENFIKLAGLEFLSPFYPRTRRLTHHYCHARAAAALSPFERALILVNDGRGDFRRGFPSGHEEILKFPAPPDLSGEACEFYTVYKQSGSRLECAMKEWQRSGDGYTLIDGPEIRDRRSMGAFYCGSGLYIFNDLFQEGKVMGLAAYGRPEALKIGKKENFFRELGEENRFRGRGKREWESSGRFEHYADVAAAVQGHFEEWLLGTAADLKRRFPEAENLILTGGCALNCAANMKLAESGLFSSVYVPPFPGDESIAFGAAAALRYAEFGEPWRPLSWESQTGSFGSAKSAPKEKTCLEVFKGWKTRRLDDPAAVAAAALAEGKIIAWFQGRSESGPRALGSRSILADPSRPGMRDYLNACVKGREGFRPYGCSVLWEDAAEYFEVPNGFESPFMSFAPKVREAYRGRLKEVVHADGTSRIQTVRPGQNPPFRRLLEGMKRRTGAGCALNTSLNVMGEPIVETLADLRRFLEKTPVDAAVAGNVLVVNRARRDAA
ncbi:MAG TPA: carbamoyltransferase C-terminal domain-containing protein [Elusimicrobiota bacterium]|nr:carbamoyltransferase C-terminal domain-containing protein [Elusimicrobiota bacterium]